MKALRIILTLLTLIPMLVPAALVTAQEPEVTRLIPPRDHSANGGMMSIKSTYTSPYTQADYIAALKQGADRLLALQADITEDNAGNGDPDADPEDGGWGWAIDPASTG